MTNIFGNQSLDDYSRTATRRGLASVFDLQGNTMRHYRFHQTGAEADFAALSDDWLQVGNSIRDAISSYDLR